MDGCTTFSTADLNRKEQVLGRRNFTTQSPSILRTRNKQQLKSENATLSRDLASSWDHFENQGPLTFLVGHVLRFVRNGWMVAEI